MRLVANAWAYDGSLIAQSVATILAAQRAAHPRVKGTSDDGGLQTLDVRAVCDGLVGLLGVVSVAGQAAQEPAQPMAENVFKNIQVLKGIPADEFMDTMGMFASSLIYDCTGCHVEDILVRREAFAEATPRIQRARQMVVMVNALNKQYFGGQPRVTCFTCHRGSGFPETIPDLNLQVRRRTAGESEWHHVVRTRTGAC